MPVDRLSDGTWLYAPFGQVLVVGSGRQVVCHACGEPLTAISRAHLSRHGLGLPAYREKYGLNRKQSLLSPRLAARRAAEGRRRLAENDQVRNGLAIGQNMARSGELYQLGAAAQPAGARRAQGRMSASKTGASPALAAQRTARTQAAERRWTGRAQALGYASLEEYLTTAREQHFSKTRVRRDLGLGGTSLVRLLGDSGGGSP